jgi:hypothetical protein
MGAGATEVGVGAMLGLGLADGWTSTVMGGGMFSTETPAVAV